MSPINRSTLTRSEPLCALDAKGLNMRSGRCARAVRKTQIGFTLIELMVVVGLVAILTAIAMPSYTDYIKRGQIVAFAMRTDCPITDRAVLTGNLRR